MDKRQVILLVLISLLGIVFFSAPAENDAALTGYAVEVPCNENNNDRECTHLTDGNDRPFVCRQRVPWKAGTKGGFWAERNFATREAATCREKIPVNGPCRRNAHCASNVCSAGHCAAERPAAPAAAPGSCEQNGREDDNACRGQVDNRGRPLICRKRVPYVAGADGNARYEWRRRNFAANEPATCRQKVPYNGPCTRNAQCMSNACSQGRCAAAPVQPGELELTSQNIRKIRTTQETIRPGVFKETTRYEIRRRSGPPVQVAVQETRSGCFDVQTKRNAAFTILFIGDGYTLTRDLERDVKKLVGVGTSGGLFGTKPFDQHVNKFNVKAMIASTGTRELGRTHSETGHAVAKTVALASSRKKASRCSGTIDYVVTIAKEDFRSICFPWLSCLVSVGQSVDADDQKMFVHEFGHGFAGLVDEYVDASVTEAFDDYGDIVNFIFQENIRDVMGLFEFLGVSTPPNCVRTQAETQAWTSAFPNHQLSISRGCGFSSRYYRATRNSIMRDHTQSSFGPVSEKRILDVINGQKILRRNSLLYDVPDMLDTFTTIADVTYALEDAYDWGEDAVEVLEEAWDDIAEGAEDAAESVWETMEDIGEGMAEGAEDVGEGAERVGEGIAWSAERAWDEVSSWW